MAKKALIVYFSGEKTYQLRVMKNGLDGKNSISLSKIKGYLCFDFIITGGASSLLQLFMSFALRYYLFKIPIIFEKNFSSYKSFLTFSTIYNIKMEYFFTLLHTFIKKHKRLFTCPCPSYRAEY